MIEWKNIKWKPIEFDIFKLQKKIYQASKNKNEFEMVRLQKILLSSNAAKLKGLDGTYIIKRRRASSINIIRYADDFVILHENEFIIKSCKEFIQTFLLNLGLKLKDTKTRICHTLYDFEDQPAGFDFLGFNICQYLIGKYAVRKTKVSLNFRT